MKYSKQRELIREAVLHSDVHPTADCIYQYLKPDHPKLSLGTVYRNLNILCEQGIINKISMPNARDRYDGHAGEHYHAICDCCGKIQDVQLSHLRCIDDELKQQIDFKVLGHCLTIHGICHSCKRKELDEVHENERS